MGRWENLSALIVNCLKTANTFLIPDKFPGDIPLIFVLRNKKMDHTTEGSLFIVDISGFTEMVEATKSDEGVRILRKLLAVIIEANKLDLSISEIEGDAVLFYKLGQAMPVSDILEQFQVMLNAFRAACNVMEREFPITGGLSLKAVVHHGELTVFRIKGFEKLYGKIMIDAHRLLKNTIERNTYVLMTNDYLRSAVKAPLSDTGWYDIERCDWYDLGNLCYHYFFHDDHKTSDPEITAGRSMN